MEMNEKHEKDLLGHIGDIKNLVIKLALSFVITFSVAYYIHPRVIAIVKEKFLNGYALHYFTIEAPFFLSLKVSFLLSTILFLPFLVFFFGDYLACMFKRKYMLAIYSIAALVLFLMGVTLGFFYITPFVVKLMFQMAETSIQFSLNAASFFNTIFMLCAVFGIVFEIPIIMFALLQTGVVSIEKIRKFRKMYVILSFIVGAIFTPPDVFSQVVVALLLIALFEVTLVIFSIFGKKNAI